MQTILEALGQKMRELRAKRGISQEDFADACGLHRTAVGLLERGERWPRLDTLLRISKGFGITVSQLLRWIEKGTPNLPKRRPIR